jgi:hypothetical protein
MQWIEDGINIFFATFFALVVNIGKLIGLIVRGLYRVVCAGLGASQSSRTRQQE